MISRTQSGFLKDLPTTISARRDFEIMNCALKVKWFQSFLRNGDGYGSRYCHFVQ